MPLRLCLFVAIVALAGCGSRSASPRAPNRFSVTLEQDFGAAAGKDVCSREAQIHGGFACFRARGSQYHGSPIPARSSDVAGLGAATTRVLVGVDRVLFRNWALGVRGGLVVRGNGPKADGAETDDSLRFHAEARVAYWFGRDPFANRLAFEGPLPGWGARRSTPLSHHRGRRRRSLPPRRQPFNPRFQTLDVYKKSRHCVPRRRRLDGLRREPFFRVLLEREADAALPFGGYGDRAGDRV